MLPEETQLLNLISRNDVNGLHAHLQLHPDLNINCLDASGSAPLHHAALHGGREVVTMILSNPRVYSNKRDNAGNAPILVAVSAGNLGAFRALLGDQRVDVGLQDVSKRTPLWIAAYRGDLSMVRWLIASDRPFNPNRKGKSGNQDYTPEVIAMARGHNGVASLLDRYVKDPKETRLWVKCELGLLADQVPHLYALLLFYCDGLLRLKANDAVVPAGVDLGKLSRIRRFFSVGAKLPLELQMVLCYRACGSFGDTILSADSEKAFKDLAASLMEAAPSSA